MNIKRAINQKLKTILQFILKKSIIFESSPAMSDNTKAVFDELLRRNYQKKYNLIWYLDDQKVAIYKNGKYVIFNPGKRNTFKERISNFIFYGNRKCVIVCNKFISKESNEVYINLTHGSPLKSVNGYYTYPNYIDYVFAQSNCFISSLSADCNYDQNRIIATGFPRNDVFFKNKISLTQLFGVSDINKTIIWLPTYRQHKNGMKTGSRNAIPLVNDYETAIRINDCLADNHIILVLKPHYAQDLSLIKRQKLSNMIVVDNSYLQEHNIDTYDLVAASDALLTDYSSIYYDYTLCDKPIGAIWEDFNEYKENPGFSVDIDYWMKGAEKIYTCADLQQFIIRVAKGIDLLKDERHEIRNKANYANDGNNSKRVVDKIVELAHL